MIEKSIVLRRGDRYVEKDPQESKNLSCEAFTRNVPFLRSILSSWTGKRKKKIAANKQNQTTIKRKQDKGKHYNQKKKKKNHSLEAFKM